MGRKSLLEAIKMGELLYSVRRGIDLDVPSISQTWFSYLSDEQRIFDTEFSEKVSSTLQ